MRTTKIIIGALVCLAIAYAINLLIMATQQPKESIPVATHTESGVALKDLPPSFKIGECQVYKITVDSVAYLIIQTTNGPTSDCAIIKHEPKK